MSAGWKSTPTGITPRPDPRLCEGCDRTLPLREVTIETASGKNVILRLCADCALAMAGVERD